MFRPVTVSSSCRGLFAGAANVFAGPLGLKVEQPHGTPVSVELRSASFEPLWRSCFETPSAIVGKSVAWALIESYEASTERLYLAALMLEGAGDPATGGHLAGVAAECAVKAVLERAGVAIDRASGFKVHIPQLVQALVLNAATRHSSQIIGALPALQALAAEYTIHTRYAAEGVIDDLRCAAWRTNVESVLLSCGFSA